MSLERPLESLSDDELLRGLADLLSQSRRAESALVAHIAEVETRRLYAREAAPSMFVYCMDVLHLSEAEAYLRITAARAAREHPVLLPMLADGRLHLSGIAKLAPHLPSNQEAIPSNREEAGVTVLPIPDRDVSSPDLSSSSDGRAEMTPSQVRSSSRTT